MTTARPSPAATAVTIEAPAETLQDVDLHVRITGLAPATRYAVRSDFVTHGGSIWRSGATFDSDSTGMIDLATMAPVEGSWQRADAQAFIWSMEKTRETPSTTSILENEDQSIVTVTVFQDTTAVAEKRITLLKRARGVSTTEIRDTVIGTFYQPYGRRSLPAVIVLGGSEGGMNRPPAALLASHGYAALALAYFGVPPLPEQLDRIPVETIDRAVEWLRAQPTVNRDAIAVFGGSKGAELALLAASRNPSIRAVVAIAPSSVVYQGITGGRDSSSSWTAGGKQLPFAGYVGSDAFTKSHRLVDLYEPTLAAAPAEAVIPVEKIRGPILLVAGKNDALWPSAVMSDRIVQRAKQMRFTPRIVQLTLDDAGHHVANVPNRPTGDSVRLGGSAAGLAAAQFQSWRAIVSFLDQSLRAKH
jgi:dienelactone hydrolase